MITDADPTRRLYWFDDHRLPLAPTLRCGIGGVETLRQAVESLPSRNLHRLPRWQSRWLVELDWEAVSPGRTLQDAGFDIWPLVETPQVTVHAGDDWLRVATKTGSQQGAGFHDLKKAVSVLLEHGVPADEVTAAGFWVRDAGLHGLDEDGLIQLLRVHGVSAPRRQITVPR